MVRVLKGLLEHVCSGGPPAILWLICIPILSTVLVTIVTMYVTKYKKTVYGLENKIDDYFQTARKYWARPNVIFCAPLRYREVEIFNIVLDLQETYLLKGLSFIGIIKIAEYEDELLRITEKVTGGSFDSEDAVIDSELLKELSTSQINLSKISKKSFLF